LNQVEAKNQQIRLLELDINVKKDELLSLGDLVDTLQKEMEELKLYDVGASPRDPLQTEADMEEKTVISKTSNIDHEHNISGSHSEENEMFTTQLTLEHQGSFLGNGVVDANIGVVFGGGDGQDNRDNLIPDSEDYDGSELDAAIGYNLDELEDKRDGIESDQNNNDKDNHTTVAMEEYSEDNQELFLQYEQLKAREEELRRELAEKAKLLTESKKELDAMKNIESVHTKTITELTDLINGLKTNEIGGNLSDVNSDDLNSEDIRQEIEQAEEKLILKKKESEDKINLSVQTNDENDDSPSQKENNKNNKNNTSNDNAINKDNNKNSNDNDKNNNTTHNLNKNNNNNNNNTNTKSNNNQHNLGWNINNTMGNDDKELTAKSNPIEKSPATHVLNYMWQGTPLHLQTPIAEESNIVPDFTTPKGPPNEITDDHNNLIFDSNMITPGGFDELLSGNEKPNDDTTNKMNAAYEQRIKLMQGMLEAEKKKNKDLLQNLEDKNNNLDQMRDEKKYKNSYIV